MFTICRYHRRWNAKGAQENIRPPTFPATEPPQDDNKHLSSDVCGIETAILFLSWTAAVLEYNIDLLALFWRFFVLFENWPGELDDFLPLCSSSYCIGRGSSCAHLERTPAATIENVTSDSGARSGHLRVNRLIFSYLVDSRGLLCQKRSANRKNQCTPGSVMRIRLKKIVELLNKKNLLSQLQRTSSTGVISGAEEPITA